MTEIMKFLINSLQTTSYRAPSQKPSSPENISTVSPIAPSLRDASPISLPISTFDDRTTDPELAKYLNRDYWEQRGNNASNEPLQPLQPLEMPANPTAPSPMATPQPTNFPINPNASAVNIFRTFLQQKC